MKAKKSLGQNFLTDEKIVEKIASIVCPKKSDLLIEIGPGMGALTKYLALKEVPFVAYEIDERMKSYLSLLSVKVFYQDFLTTDFSELPPYQDLYVVANIPYYITTPIIEHLLKEKKVPKEMVLLVQKEVALRFCSLPNTSTYGYFTVFLNHYFHIHYLFSVSPSSFTPSPKVTSAVVHFIQKEKIEDLEEEAFFSFVKRCFSMKRKTLKNNLSKEEWIKIKPKLIAMNKEENVRAEALSYEEFVELFKIVSNK